jgi:hypothetical protein
MMGHRAESGLPQRRWLRSKDASASVKVRGISVSVDREKLRPMGHLNLELVEISTSRYLISGQL